MPSAESSLDRIAENTTPKRRLLQRFGDVCVDPSEVIAITDLDASNEFCDVHLSTGTKFQLSWKLTVELLQYLTLDTVT